MIRSSRIPALIAVYLLFAMTAGAQEVSFAVEPPGPTSRTPITIEASVVSCDEPSPTVQLLGDVIKVHFTNITFCDPPQLIPARVRIPGLLAPGQYRIDVTTAGNNAVVSRTIIVRNGEPQAITAHPFAVPNTLLAPISVRLVGNEPICPGSICRITVDNIDALHERSDDEGGVWFTPPQHAPGFADIRIDNGPRTITLPKAIYYFDRNAAANISLFERVLFPLLTEVPGVNGSRFLTETSILNPKRWFIENYNEIVPFVCIDYPCGERLSPGELVKFEGGEYPNGVALLVPRSEAANLSFALRARDVSRQAEGFGTEIPVVREAAMERNRPVMLLGVPVASGYRAKLRIYAFDPEGSYARVRFRGFINAEVVVDLKRNCSGRTCASTPWYGEVDLPGASGVGGAGTFDVQIYGPYNALTWAFVTVTNNETQQITTIIPDAKGGR